MKKVISILCLNAVILSITAQQVFVSDSLTKKWEAKGELKVPESVFFDNLNQVIYVSNVTGTPNEKDNTGFISKLSEDGKIISAQWVKGLNAPKGMGVISNLLYVSDIDRVAEIDIKSGKINRMIPVAGAKFLNDIATDAQGNVYVSDTENSTVHVIRQGKAELLVKNDRLKGINGLYMEKGKLLAGLENSIVSIDPKTKEITDYIPNTGSIDGLVPDGKGNYIISDWQGHVSRVGKGQGKKPLLDTTPAKVNAADIEYVVTKKLLLVPTFSANSVVAYEMK
jgi:DNA-binding beta-propeller fold protein YncE